QFTLRWVHDSLGNHLGPAEVWGDQSRYRDVPQEVLEDVPLKRAQDRDVLLLSTAEVARAQSNGTLHDRERWKAIRILGVGKHDRHGLVVRQRFFGLRS